MNHLDSVYNTLGGICAKLEDTCKEYDIDFMDLSYQSSMGSCQVIRNFCNLGVGLLQLHKAISRYLENGKLYYPSRIGWMPNNHQTVDAMPCLVTMNDGEISVSSCNHYVVEHGEYYFNRSVSAWAPLPDACYMDIIINGNEILENCNNNNIIALATEFYDEALSCKLKKMADTFAEALHEAERYHIFEMNGFWNFTDFGDNFENVPDDNILVTLPDRTVKVCHSRKELMRMYSFMVAWAYIPNVYNSGSSSDAEKKKEAMEQISNLCAMYGITGSDIDRFMEKKDIDGKSSKSVVVGNLEWKLGTEK